MTAEESEVLRYLGYRGAPAGEAVLKKVRSCLAELSAGCRGRSVFRRVPLSFGDDFVEAGTLRIESRDLKKHLAGCTEAYLFAATLGAQADRLLSRHEKADMSDAAVFQAAAAARIESFCDEGQERLARQAAEEGFFLRPRYSPGYGDFSIRHQRDLLGLLEAPKRIGLSMTESFLLVPTKSVTAVIGLTRDSARCHTGKCMECDAKNCPFRKEAVNESQA